MFKLAANYLQKVGFSPIWMRSWEFLATSVFYRYQDENVNFSTIIQLSAKNQL